MTSTKTIRLDAQKTVYTVLGLAALAAAASGCNGGGGRASGTTAAASTAATANPTPTPTPTPVAGIPAELLLTRSAPPPGATATWTSDPSGVVTALAHVPGEPALAGIDGAILPLDGVSSPVPLGGRISAIALASGKVYASACSTSGGTAAVHVRDAGVWQSSLLTARGACVVASFGGRACAVAGDRSGQGAIVSRLDATGTWSETANLGPFEPLAAVELAGELWIGGVTPSGVARLLRGDGAIFRDVALPVNNLPGESASVSALAVAGDHLFLSVAIRDARTLAPTQGSILGVTHAGLVAPIQELPGDAPLSLASWDGTLWIGTERGQLYLLDESGDLDQDAGFVAGGPIRALAGGDSLSVGSDGAVQEHEWTPAPVAASSLAPSSLAPSSSAPTGQPMFVVVAATAAAPAGPSAAAAAATMTFTSITPKLGPTTGATLVSIVGTNFAGITSVKIGGVALTALTVTATKITGKTGAHAAGPVDVVITSSTNGTLTKTGAFTYYVPMTLTTVAPTSGPVAGSTALTLTGTNFLNVTSVTVGGVALTSLVVTPTKITGKTAAHAAGAVDVIVKSSTNGTITKKKAFTYGVTIKAIAPATGPSGGGTAVTITGTNFLNVTSVRVGGVELSSRVVTATKITGTTGAGTAGRVDVVVVSSTQGTATKVGAFTYAAGITFATDVLPILRDSCVICHSQGGVAGSFAPFTDTAGGLPIYARVRNGVSSFNTPATYVTPGNTAASLLVLKTQAGGSMADKLTAAQAQTIKDWVLAGGN